LILKENGDEAEADGEFGEDVVDENKEATEEVG
jgi:hypothetical protein